jgi:hypothetical protein
VLLRAETEAPAIKVLENVESKINNKDADEVSDQKMPNTFLLPPSSLVLASALVIGVGSEGGALPAAAPRMIFSRCLAFSLPFSAARTYQTLASSGSRRQPMPISVK